MSEVANWAEAVRNVMGSYEQRLDKALLERFGLSTITVRDRELKVITVRTDGGEFSEAHQAFIAAFDHGYAEAAKALIAQLVKLAPPN